MAKRWTETEDLALCSLLTRKAAWGEIFERLYHRSRSGLHHRVAYLRERHPELHRADRTWNKHDEATLERLFDADRSQESAEELGRVLQRTAKAVRHRAQDMGLTHDRARRWTEADVEYLETHYQDQPTRDIAARLDRTERAVHSKAHDLGIVWRRFKPVMSDELARIRELAAAGKNGAQIARALHRHYNAISRYL